MSQTQLSPYTHLALDYAHQAEKLSLGSDENNHTNCNGGIAVEAKFVTPLDPVVQTDDGNRLPAIPVDEAHKLNQLKDKLDGKSPTTEVKRPRGLSRFDKIIADSKADKDPSKGIGEGTDTQLESAIPPARTHPLFPPLPLYGPPSRLRNLHCLLFQITSFFLSTAFLLVIVLGSVFTSVPKAAGYLWLWLTFRDPDSRRPFYDEERRRKVERKDLGRKWKASQKTKQVTSEHVGIRSSRADYTPREGGPDPLICDPRYYARRVGLDIEEFKVQTEDGFIISLWHVYNPAEYAAASAKERRHSKPEVFTNDVHDIHDSVKKQYRDGCRRYPVLLVHGLLQSAGAYCTNDDDSLAFYLCKSGYDVWLGNNRCGFTPEHSLLKPNDPRMWAWNIRQMGVMDLPAMISRVLEETGFEKLGLVAHSQGTTETFVALAKEQRPDLGNKISVFCALAPAVYAGPLIGKMYFKFMRVISPAMFRIFFGIHSFIPLMLTMHRILPGKIYGIMGYRVFSFLFNWSDQRWDRGLRDRLFQFSPVYVSSESMRWWLGRECFAKHKCILATKQEWRSEDAEDEDEDEEERMEETSKEERGSKAWYDKQVPPLALWVAGSDQLVDGRRLLRRFERGREPNVKVVHAKVIEEYEHLDVIWAINSIEKVGKEVKKVLSNTMPKQARGVCRRIEGIDSEEEVDSVQNTTS